MAKKGWKKKEKPVNAIRTSVIPSYIEELVKDAYLEYSLASIVRGIPDYRDGLKPSQRRVLYTMRNQTSLVKSVKIVGEVLGHYHPHGSDAAYETLVRLSQDFKVYVPMVIGHGNFGSLDGDAAAAYRYCCTGDTVVKTITHGNITLDKLADGMSPNSDKVIDIEVLSMDGIVNKADRIFHSGYHSIIELKLKNGLKLRGTSNHPVMILTKELKREWKTLGELWFSNKEEIVMFYNEMTKLFHYAGIESVKWTDDILPVYSIRVCSDCHSFITNGIVSHNTEARISSEAKEIYFNHNWNGVQYQANFDNTTKEPIFLPSTLPMVLVNGVKGVAVGMSAQIPTHNILEIINAYIAYIEGDLTSKNLFKYIKGPDPVIPCTVIRGKGLERAYLNGRGSFFCRMYHHIEEASRGRKNIVFTSTLPFQTKSKIIEDLAAIITDKKANGPLQNMIANISDESNMDSIRIVITLKKEANLQTVLDELLAVKFSQIRVNFTMLVITENNKPQIIGIMDLFKKFYEFQKETSIRSLTISKENIAKKLHITEGIALVIKDYDSIINVIRKAKNKEIAKEKILKLYPSLDDIQINSILDTKIISMLNKGSDVMDEIKYLKSEIKNYDLLLSNIDTYLINILKEQKKIFKSYKRRCEIVNETDGKFKLLKG